MTTTGMTTMEVRKINRRNIYTFIYEQESCSKQNLVDALHISLSTVTHNLKLLEEEGLIHRSGYFESTGGRKAYNFEIVKDARMAVGMHILKDRVHIVGLDLYGNIRKERTLLLDMTADEDYYRRLGDLASDFIREENLTSDRLLGAGIAIRGILDKSGTSMAGGSLSDNSDLRLSDLTRYMPCQCLFRHDSRAAAFANLWRNRELTDAVVLLLNPHLGGALIRSRKIYYGHHQRGGLLEHISLDPQGPPCYCGSRGCLETFCSANRLKELSGLPLETFFDSLHGGDRKAGEIWSLYLDRLAFAIRNLHVILDIPVIISGLLADYMTEEDFDRLRARVAGQAPFPFPPDFLIPGQYGPLASATGGALCVIDRWLQNV